MKHFLKVVLFSLIVLFGSSTLHAQEWEKIGWQGGKIYPSGQLGNTLYSISNLTVYRSTDWGQTWTIFSSGLPISTAISDDLSFIQLNDCICIDLSSTSLPEAGLFYSKENDNSWSFKKISTIGKVSPKILFWSGDSILSYRDSKGLDDQDGFYFQSAQA